MGKCAFDSRKCVIFVVSLISRRAHVLLRPLFYKKNKANWSIVFFIKMFLFYDGRIEVTCKKQSNFQITVVLRILTWKKHPKIKLQRLRKIQMLTFGSLVHQINSFQEVLKLEQIFQKNKVVTGKTPLFVIGPFCSRHSICLNIGFWQSSFEWKWCAFNLSGFN